MSKKQNKKQKLKKIELEENKVVKKFFIVLIIVVVCIIGIYFLTKAIVDKNNDQKEDTNKQTVEFNYDKTILGSAFNRPYDEYYIIVYNSNDSEAYSLASAISTYNQKEDHLKLYYADLDDHMNQSFYDEENVNSKATKASELKVGKYTLIKFKDGKINKFVEGTENIKKELDVE